VDLSIIAENWQLVAVSVLALMGLKAAGIYGVARLFGAAHREAVERMVLMAQGGEFAFVLYAAALSVGLFDAQANAILTAIIIISMVLTPLMVMVHDRLMPAVTVSEAGMEAPDGARAAVLLIGFGRFGQIVSQSLLARRCSITIIDTDADAIRAAEAFGFKIYYGDGTRLDILKAAGAAEARMVVIATDKAEVTTRIAHLLRDTFPDTQVLARAFDRAHAIALVKMGVDHQIRDRERFALQTVGDIYSGSSLLIGNAQDQAQGR
jgi:glutathione-regulated potassium-efflux system protein KefB